MVEAPCSSLCETPFSSYEMETVGEVSALDQYVYLALSSDVVSKTKSFYVAETAQNLESAAVY